MTAATAWDDVDRYFHEHLIGDDPALDGALQRAADAGLPAHDVAPNQGKLLHLLAQHPDETLSRERILREVFPPGDVPGTVDTYVHYLRRKTERDIVTTVRGLGYRVGRP